MCVSNDDELTREWALNVNGVQWKTIQYLDTDKLDSIQTVNKGVLFFSLFVSSQLFSRKPIHIDDSKRGTIFVPSKMFLVCAEF